MASKLNLPGMDLMKGVGIGPLNIGNVLDTMGFVRKAWGAMNAPSSFMPTMDVEELNKRIVDLQAVEQWLVMNLNMIQGSIQALEVQRATIETLKGVTRGLVPGNLGAAAGPAGLPNLAQLMQMHLPAAAQAPMQTPAPAPVMAPPAPAAPPVEPAAPSRRAPEGKAASPARKAAVADPGLSATAWLEFLQSQFNQVAQAAMTGAIAKSGKQAAKTGSKAAGAKSGKGTARKTPAASARNRATKAKS